MVKSAFSAGKRTEHMWSRITEVQVENQLVKGILDNEPLEITHLKLGVTVTIPFKDVEDVWLEGETPESVKTLLKLKADELRAPCPPCGKPLAEHTEGQKFLCWMMEPKGRD
jgi:hypothetical protein